MEENVGWVEDKDEYVFELYQPGSDLSMNYDCVSREKLQELADEAGFGVKVL